jgi:hypothetical protein
METTFDLLLLLFGDGDIWGNGGHLFRMTVLDLLSIYVPFVGVKDGDLREKYIVVGQGGVGSSY